MLHSFSFDVEDAICVFDRIDCPGCKLNKKPYSFCWECKLEWANPNSHKDCGNAGCGANDRTHEATLATCDTKTLDLSGMVVPRFRACPRYHDTPGPVLIEWESNCKHMR